MRRAVLVSILTVALLALFVAPQLRADGIAPTFAASQYSGPHSSSKFLTHAHAAVNTRNSLSSVSVVAAPVNAPEPSALLLLCAGLCVMLFCTRRKKLFV